MTTPLTRENRKPEKRKPLSRRDYAYLALKQEGRCGCGCGRKLDFKTERAITDEHILALFEGGTNDLDNRQLWVTDPCAKSKTAKEKPVQAKIRRRRGEKGQQKRLKERGKSSIQSAPFDSKPPGYVSPLSKNHPRYQKRKMS